MPVPLSRIEHQGKVGGLDAADERAVRVRFELDGSFVDEGVHIVDGPVAVTLDAQTIAKALVLYSSRVQVGGTRIDRLEDLELHRQLGDRPGVALLLDQLVDLCFEVGDLLLVVVHPTNESTAAHENRWWLAIAPAIRMALMLTTFIIG